MNVRSILPVFFIGAMTSIALAQTKPGSANAVDPYAPTPVQNPAATPPVDAGTDTPMSTPANPDVSVNAARLAKLDKDKDGRISLAEFTAGYTETKVTSTNAAGMQSGTGDATTLFKQLDADNDGYLSATELANADAKQLKK
jgi:Ca2+-binding EF-hand superfamily protein